MLTPDVDSYVTVDEADTYFAEHYGYDLWDPLTEEQKEQALRSAVMKLDLSCRWYGSKCDDDQPLQFPRDVHGCETPNGIKAGQCEIAYLMVTAGTANPDQENELSELTAGPVTLKWNTEPEKVDPLESGIVVDLLSQYGSCSKSGSGTSIIPMYRG